MRDPGIGSAIKGSLRQGKAHRILTYVRHCERVFLSDIPFCPWRGLFGLHASDKEAGEMPPPPSQRRLQLLQIYVCVMINLSGTRKGQQDRG